MKKSPTKGLKVAYTPVLHVKNSKELRALEEFKLEIAREKQPLLSNNKIEVKGLGVFSLY